MKGNSTLSRAPEMEFITRCSLISFPGYSLLLGVLPLCRVYSQRILRTFNRALLLLCKKLKILDFHSLMFWLREKKIKKWPVDSDCSHFRG